MGGFFYGVGLCVLVRRLLEEGFIRCFILFFVLVSVVTIVTDSFRRVTACGMLLFNVACMSSFVFLVRCATHVMSTPTLCPNVGATGTHLGCAFSFCNFISFITMLPYILACTC